MKSSIVIVLLLSVILAGTLIVSAQEINTTSNTTTIPTNTTTELQGIVQTIMSNPQTATVMLIEFLLGFGLGYTAIKALKYILSFIGILLLGSTLSIWSIGANSTEIAEKLGIEVKQLLPLLKGLMTAFGTIIVGPASIGAIVGIIVATIRKES